MEADEIWDEDIPTFSFDGGMSGNDVSFEAAISETVYLELQELAVDDGTCAVSGDAIDDGDAWVLGYVGPYEDDGSDDEFSCGALLQIGAKNMVAFADVLDLTFGDGTESVDVTITINNPWPSVADLEDDDRYDPSTVVHTFDVADRSWSNTAFTAESGNYYFVSMSGLSGTNGDCAIYSRERDLGWIDLIGFVGPYTDGDDFCGVYFQISDIIPDGTRLTFMLRDGTVSNAFTLTIDNPEPVWDDVADMESTGFYILVQHLQPNIAEHSIDYNSDPETDDEISFGTNGGSTLQVLLAGLDALSGTCQLTGPGTSI